ncbi:hypothetical protein PIB30_042804 [Stylosanthes scabra]|uniref:Uncharacterized protein n=1 Tax=Stylosanthes scabra TaxID=79078 RepID=A0ABU6SFQ8_9FABA|nr:hypothetical protein [Stylosanthes scabra]
MKFLSTEVQMGLKKRGRTLEENEDLATANEENSSDSYNSLINHFVDPSSSRSGNRKKRSVPLFEDVFVSVKSPVNCLLAPVEDVTFSDSEEYRYVLDNVVSPDEHEDEEEYRYYLDNIYNLEEDEEDLGVEDVAEDPLIGDVAEDPQYKYFLDNVRAGETCYVIEIPEKNICIEYPDVALTIASEAQNKVANYSGKRRGRKPKCLGQMVKDAHDVHPKAQNHAGEYRKRGRKPKDLGQDMVKDSHGASQKAQNNVGNCIKKRRGRKPKYVGQMVKDAHDVLPKVKNHVVEHKKRGRKPKYSGQDMVKDSHGVSQNVQNHVNNRRGWKPNGLGEHAVKDSNGHGNANAVEASKAQNHDGKYNGKRRGRKPKELRNDAVKGSNGSSNSGASEAKKNDHIAKGDHILAPCVLEIKVKEEIEEDDDDALCKRMRKGPSLNLEHFWHDDKANANKYTNYREKLMQELLKPYSKEEYTRLLTYVKGKKPVEYHRECRNGPKTCKRSYLGKCLLNHHVDLTNKIKSARADEPKALNLLRGFVFWLTHCSDDDAFKPWIDQRCCFPAPQK